MLVVITSNSERLGTRFQKVCAVPRGTNTAEPWLASLRYRQPERESAGKDVPDFVIAMVKV